MCLRDPLPRLALAFGRPVDMSSRSVDPLRRLGITDEVKEPAEERNPVASTEAELGSVRGEGFRERAWKDVVGSDRISHYVCDGFRVLLVEKEV